MSTMERRQYETAEERVRHEDLWGLPEEGGGWGIGFKCL